MLAFASAAASGLLACAVPADELVGKEGYGLVVGSVQVQLAREREGVVSSPFTANLVRPGIRYAFHFVHERQPWNRAPASVETLGSAQPFALSLMRGRNRVSEIELELYEGPSAWLLGFFSPVDGRTVGLDVGVESDPRRITYIGRIRVVLPSRLGPFAGPVRVVVEDASADDVEAMRTLVERVGLPVETHLATLRGAAGGAASTP